MMLKTKFSSKVDLSGFGTELFNFLFCLSEKLSIHICKPILHKQIHFLNIEARDLNTYMTIPGWVLTK